MSAVWRRRVRDLLLLVLVLLSLIDATPNWLVPGLDRVERVARKPLLALGIWQGNYQLFAPDPDRVNEWLLVEVGFEDGREATWTTWDWRQRSFIERIARGQAHKYVEQVSRNNQGLLHQGLARWATQNLRPQGGGRPRVSSVRITRHRWIAPPPGPARDEQWARFGTLPPPREAYNVTRVLYERTSP